VLHVGCHNEYIASPRNVLATKRGKNNLTLDDLHADWSSGVVSFHGAARCDGDDRNPQGPLLDEGAGSPSVPSEERPINHPLILFQMMDEYVTLESAFQR
jgi:hypothetical protein